MRGWMGTKARSDVVLAKWKILSCRKQNSDRPARSLLITLTEISSLLQSHSSHILYTSTVFLSTAFHFIVGLSSSSRLYAQFISRPSWVPKRMWTAQKLSAETTDIKPVDKTKWTYCLWTKRVLANCSCARKCALNILERTDHFRCHHVFTGSGAHIISCQMGTATLFPGVKSPWSLALV
jgi:hypothetical protein